MGFLVKLTRWLGPCALAAALAGCMYDLDALGPEKLPPNQECNEVAQTGCKAGEKCAICVSGSSTRTQACAAGEGTKTAGEVCANDAECAPGTQCWNAVSGTGFVCRQFCNTAADCPTSMPTCAKVQDGFCHHLMVSKATFGMCQ